MTSNEEQEEPVAKKLRSSEPDLCVTVGQDGGKKKYRYHSQVLASHSNYVDTMLASPMKESQSMEVHFPDLTPDTWELMMDFLTNPVKAHDMTLADAMKVAAGYDKYEFPMGLELCDRVMSNVFKRNPFIQDIQNILPIKKPDIDLDCLIDAFILADQAHLENTKKEACEFFRLRFSQCRQQYGCWMFTEVQIKRLAPLIAQENLLYWTPLRFTQLTKEEILSPLFPDYFVSKMKDEQAFNVIRRAVRGLKLTGCEADCSLDNTMLHYCFHCDRTIRWGGVDRIIRIRKLDGGDGNWVISADTEPEVDEDGEEDWDLVDVKILWTNPHSSNMLLPPESGWEPVDELAKGDPKIEYIYSSNE